MRAVAVRAFRGTPELLDLEPPAPGPGEVRVRMAAAGINPFDWKIIDGVLDGRRPHRFPLVLGVDGAGRVDQLGPGASRFRAGDPIFGQFLHDPIGIGTMAEFATVPETIGIARVPDEMGPVRAAALPTAGMTALDALDRLGVPAGGTVVVVGASGGIGSYAIQLARARGIEVVAVARGESEDRVVKLGASEFVEYCWDTMVDRIRSAYPKGVDALLDVVDKSPDLARLVPVVRRGGRAATTVYAAEPNLAPASGVELINLDLQPTADLLSRLTDEVLRHHLTVPIERTIPLEEAPAAIGESRAGRTSGKTVVRVAEVIGSGAG